MANTPNLGLPILSASQASKHVTMNQSLRKLDALCTPFVKVKDRDLATPPGSPADGDRYIVAASPTGAWAGQAGKVAYYDTNAWVFYTPVEGWIFYVDDEDMYIEYNGTTFVGHPQTQQNLSKLGVNTTADNTNKLAVNSSAILFNHIGNGIQIKVNKNASGDSNSFLFQTGFSGRAEIGCMGVDDFLFKNSPDGSAFYTGIRMHRLLHGRTNVKHAYRNYRAEIIPQAGVAGITTIGMATNADGTLTLVAPSASNLFTQSPRVKYVSAGSSGASCGVRGSQLFLWRGNASDMGGFYLVMRGGIETFQSTCRMFMGLRGSTASIGNVNPSTLVDMIGIGFDSSQTTLRLFNNDGSGTATALDLGANFPTTGGQDLYELVLSAEPNASEIRYRVERLNSGHIAEGALTTDLPTNTVFLTPHFWFNNGTTAGAVEMAVHGMVVEQASMLGSRNNIAG